MKRSITLSIAILLMLVSAKPAMAHMSAWKVLVISGKVGSYIAFEKDDSGKYFVHIKYVLEAPYGHFSHREGDKISFDFTDGSYIALYNKSFVVTCIGCGAWSLGYSKAYGMYRVFEITPEEYNNFKTKTLNYFSFEYWKLDDRKHKFTEYIKPKRSEKLQDIMLW